MSLFDSATQQKTTLHDGVARCTRYAFGPNKLHLCGPDANAEVLAYIQAGATDPGLSHILQGFATLYPYLKEIAHANHIVDVFDDRVVEAYWLGNELLEAIPAQQFFRHLRDNLDLKRKYGAKEFDELVGKLPKGARMHHSFHVLNAYKRTGHDAKLHTLESMDSCRVSWGSVVAMEGPKITVRRKPLLQQNRKLVLGAEEDTTIMRRLEEDATLDDLAIGDLVSMHWGVICEIIDPKHVQWLQHYTLQSISLSNETL